MGTMPKAIPTLYECALGLESCTGPSAMRVDQLPLLHMWPLFVLAGLVGAAVLWNLHAAKAGMLFAAVYAISSLAH